jgi:hypothetical protein
MWAMCDWILEFDVQYGVHYAQDGGGKQGNVQVSCSLAQMQDLVSKLKDASKRLETLAANS